MSRPSSASYKVPSSSSGSGATGYGGYGDVRLPAASKQHEFSPYQQQQQPARPSSSGATRQSRGSVGSSTQPTPITVTSATSGSAMNYARNVNQAGGTNMYMGGSPIISGGLLGSSFNPQQQQQQQQQHSRPSSAGHSRPSAGQSAAQNGQLPPATQQTSSAQQQYAGSSSNQSNQAGSSRPKSAGAVRRQDAPLNIMGSSNIVAQQQLYYQQQQALLQQQLPQNIDKNSYNFTSTSGSRPATNTNDHWSTSYKLHYGFSNSGVQPSPLMGGAGGTSSATGAGTSSASAGAGATASAGDATSRETSSSGTGMPPATAHIAPASQRPSSASATTRIRTAIDHSHKYAAVVGAMEEGATAIHVAGTAAGGADGDDATGLDDDRNGEREVLNRGGVDDDDEMDGKPFDSRSHPEVSTTTPSQSIELGGSSVDIRASSMESLPEELIDVGLSTVPNQFCGARDALELKKLLLMSKGSRGGIVPSSTAVMDMYMVGKVVGVGSYGKVRAAWHRLTGSKVAIKTYDKSKLKDPAHWKRVHSEIKIMEQVSHPRIARMYEAVETPKRMHLIMECLDGGNLCSYVKAKRRLTEDESRRIFFQIMQAIEYLHMLGVTHRDVKLENVLFADNKDIKLIDFGFSTVCQAGKRLKVFCGTPSYMAPEIVRRTEYEGKPVDMWSMGILLYALLCGCFPFRAKSYPDLYRRIARGTFVIPEELSVSVKDLLRQLLTVDVAQRITSHAALRHPWLQMQLATSPDINKLRLETLILISDKPSDDIDEQTLAEMERFGIMRDEVIRLILTKTHSAIASFYYLLLEIMVTKRRLLGKRSTAGSAAKRVQSASAAGRSASSSAQNQDQGASMGYTYTGATQPSRSGADMYQQHQQQQQQQAQQQAQAQAQAQTTATDSYTLLRPKSASATRPANSGPARPLSAFAGRR